MKPFKLFFQALRGGVQFGRGGFLLFKLLFRSPKGGGLLRNFRFQTSDFFKRLAPPRQGAIALLGGGLGLLGQLPDAPSAGFDLILRLADLGFELHAAALNFAPPLLKRGSLLPSGFAFGFRFGQGVFGLLPIGPEAVKLGLRGGKLCGKLLPR